MNGIPQTQDNCLSAKIAPVPGRMTEIDASLGALQDRIESLSIKISPALNEATPCDPSKPRPTIPPSASQIEASLYNFNQRIEQMVDDVNRLIDRVAI